MSRRASSASSASTNVNVIPFSVTYAKGDVHWYYEADLFHPGGGYSQSGVLNVGQHNLAAAPVAGFTYLPKQGKAEISSRFMLHLQRLRQGYALPQRKRVSLGIQHQLRDF